MMKYMALALLAFGLAGCVADGYALTVTTHGDGTILQSFPMGSQITLTAVPE